MIECLEDLRPSPTLLVAFTGMQHRLGAIPYEFNHTLANQPLGVVYVRDLDVKWYQYDRCDIDRVIGKIRRAAADVGSRRVACLGNSMGGFGALLFGSLLRADAIVAFAPQSAIDPEVTAEIGDHRWVEEQANISRYPNGDLTRLDPPPCRPTVVIGHEPADAIHAERLRRSWNAEVLEVAETKHNVAKVLLRRGELTPMLQRLLL